MLIEEEERVKDSWTRKTKSDYHAALIARGLYQLRHQLAALFKDPKWPELNIEDFLIKFDLDVKTLPALPGVSKPRAKSVNEPAWMMGLRKKEVSSRAAWAMWTNIDMASGKQQPIDEKTMKRKH